MYLYLFNLPAHWPEDRWILLSAPGNNIRKAAKQAVKDHFKGSTLPHEVEIILRLKTKKVTAKQKISKFKIINEENGEQSIENLIDRPVRPRQKNWNGPRLKGMAW